MRVGGEFSFEPSKQHKYSARYGSLHAPSHASTSSSQHLDGNHPRPTTLSREKSRDVTDTSKSRFGAQDSRMTRRLTVGSSCAAGVCEVGSCQDTALGAARFHGAYGHSDSPQACMGPYGMVLTTSSRACTLLLPEDLRRDFRDHGDCLLLCSLLVNARVQSLAARPLPSRFSSALPRSTHYYPLC